MLSQRLESCEHCYHEKQEPVLMWVKDGHVVQECCKCSKMRTVHRDHAGGRR